MNVRSSSPAPLRRASGTETATTTITSRTATKLRIQQRLLLLLFSGERCPTASIVLVKKRPSVSANSSVGLPFALFTLAARVPKSAYEVRPAVTSLRAPPLATAALSLRVHAMRWRLLGGDSLTLQVAQPEIRQQAGLALVADVIVIYRRSCH